MRIMLGLVRKQLSLISQERAMPGVFGLDKIPALSVF